MHKVMVDYFKKNCVHRPIWTTVQVAGLGNPNYVCKNRYLIDEK